MASRTAKIAAHPRPLSVVLVPAVPADHPHGRQGPLDPPSRRLCLTPPAHKWHSPAETGTARYLSPYGAQPPDCLPCHLDNGTSVQTGCGRCERDVKDG